MIFFYNIFALLILSLDFVLVAFDHSFYIVICSNHCIKYRIGPGGDDGDNGLKINIISIVNVYLLRDINNGSWFTYDYEK